MRRGERRPSLTRGAWECGAVGNDPLKSGADRGRFSGVTGRMRKLRFVPLAFVVGAEGVVLVVPYLVLFLAVVVMVRSWQARAALVAAAG